MNAADQSLRERRWLDCQAASQIHRRRIAQPRPDYRMHTYVALLSVAAAVALILMQVAL